VAAQTAISAGDDGLRSSNLVTRQRQGEEQLRLDRLARRRNGTGAHQHDLGGGGVLCFSGVDGEKRRGKREHDAGE
jgi:hypothetical protein